MTIKSAVKVDSMFINLSSKFSAVSRITAYNFIARTLSELKLGYLAHNQDLVAAKKLKLLRIGGNKTNLSSYTPAPPAAVFSVGRRDGITRLRCHTLSGRIPESLTGEKKRVVVVGGGVGGSLISQKLQNDADVILIDPKEYYEIPWAKLRAMVEPSFAERFLINHSDYLPNAQVITSAATGITETDALTAQGRSFGYDYLVIATGHAHTGDITKVERLHYFQAEQEKIKSANSILIVGGGPTGVELAGEISVDFPDKKVTIVHRGSRLLEFIGEKAGKKALNWLTSRKVEVILNQSVSLDSQTDGVYETSGGERIIADCHFLCAGLGIGSSWLKETILRDSLDMEGRLMVDAKLQVKGHPNVFAIGDITDIRELKLGYFTSNHALVAAKNLKLLMSGRNKTKLSTYTPSLPTATVSLGRREGIMQICCLTLSGRIPGMVKSADLFVTKSRKERGLRS